MPKLTFEITDLPRDIKVLSRVFTNSTWYWHISVYYLDGSEKKELFGKETMTNAPGEKNREHVREEIRYKPGRQLFCTVSYTKPEGGPHEKPTLRRSPSADQLVFYFKDEAQDDSFNDCVLHFTWPTV